MPTSYLEFLVEDVSTKAFLDACLPKILPEDCSHEIYPSQGKHAMLKNLGNRLRGYALWLPANHRIVVVMDRDNDDCQMLKSDLEQICLQAGLQTKRERGSPDWQVVTRIAIEELEAWYFGDWQAVCSAYPRVPMKIQNKAPFRFPDDIKGGTCEAFERIMKKYGYFKQGLRKVEVASAIGRHINPDCNRSRSFNHFRNALNEAIK